MATAETPNGVRLLTLDPATFAEHIENDGGFGRQSSALVAAFDIEVGNSWGTSVVFRRNTTADPAIAPIEVTVDYGKSEIDEVASRLLLYGETLVALFCLSCWDLLLAKEYGICGACEARSALDIVALARELRADA